MRLIRAALGQCPINLFILKCSRVLRALTEPWKEATYATQNANSRTSIEMYKIPLSLVGPCSSVHQINVDLDYSVCWFMK